jgi:two-component system, cell cycle response regulator
MRLKELNTNKILEDSISPEVELVFNSLLLDQVTDLKTVTYAMEDNLFQDHTHNHYNILVVDDHPANLNLLMQILTGHGYRVRVSPNASLALRSIQLMQPDLILLDINMPDMDGYTFCQLLKRDTQTKAIPIIFISALGEPGDKVRGFNLGAVDYITKPFEPVEVLARIEYHLRWQESQIQLKIQNNQLQLLLSISQAINEAEDIDSALEVVLAQVCQSLGWDMGLAWIFDHDHNCLVCSPGYYIRDDNLISFYDHEKALKFTPGLGLVGTVWSTQKPQWVDDLRTVREDRFIGADKALAVGIYGALCVPVICQQSLVAIMLFFRGQPLTIKKDILHLVMAVADQLGSLIQRRQAEDQLRQLNLELKRLANLDGLTQVANRRRFDDYLAQEWKRSLREEQYLSLILCDVDYFKAYNDSYGHLAGDECLQKVAQTMSENVKRPADLVARYGGEEFVVVLPNTPAKGAHQVAATLKHQLEELQLPHAQSLVKPYVTMSLGVASVIPRSNLSLEDLIACADVALYEAKRQGRNKIIVQSIVSVTDKETKLD